MVLVANVVVSADIFVVVADGNHSGHDHDHGPDHDLPPLSRDYGPTYANRRSGAEEVKRMDPSELLRTREKIDV